MVRLTADFTEKIRPMGKMNGMNNGPLHLYYDAAEEFREMGVDFVRYHETHFGAGKCIEVPFVFPNFDADEYDENNYYFDQTDAVIKSAVDSSIEIMYRFGMGTENALPKIFCVVPKDYAKWARICIQILKHYNDGWANGFHYGIKLCEIWNEADLYNYWPGEYDEYIKFYCIAAKLMKEYDPTLKIGCSGFAGGIPIKPSESAPDNIKENYRKRYDFFHNYLETVIKTGAPLDFFAWHYYIYNSTDCVRRLDGVFELLREYGLENIENINTEWGPITLHRDSKGEWDLSQGYTIKSAITCLASMLVMQNYGTTKAAYYNSELLSSFCGLYDYDGSKKHTFYSMKAFSMLRKGEYEYRTNGQTDNIRICASYNGEKAYVIVTCENEDEEISLKLCGIDKARISYYLLDKTHDLEFVRRGSFSGRAINLKMSGNSAYLLEIEKQIDVKVVN